ncbi:hypothetical protein [Burkholderia sp. BE12]|uniref:hypothetical protein n=1 Tax=Burkholderia sp. BE12 TaxID=2082394 RepID=UPI001F393AFF|nr:hypothetical protein [Burkholderia sp. BE12]
MNIAWHRSIGRLIETLDQPGFRLSLIRLIEEYVAVDSRVAPMFGDASPQAFAECPYEGATLYAKLDINSQSALFALFLKAQTAR